MNGEFFLWLVAHGKKAWVGLPAVTWGEALLTATLALVILAWLLFDALRGDRPRL
jgi:hypothetical protein